MPNLFPIGYEAEIMTDEEVEEPFVGYRPGIAFDFYQGDFMLDGKNMMLRSTGIESWKSWCYNCVSTQRYRHLAYDSDFGVDTGPAFRAESREEAESWLTREITEAILADPYQRTKYIEDMTFDWIAPDTVLIHLTLYGVQDVTIDFDVTLKGGKQS